MRIGAFAIALLLLAAPAMAADVDGNWAGAVATPNGDFPVAFTFKADGATLTGSMQGMDGAPIPIKNGKIEGSTVSFSISLDFGGMPFELSYKGVVAPAEITFQGDAGGMPFELVVKKAN